MDEEAHSTARTERIRIEADSREIATRDQLLYRSLP